MKKKQQLGGVDPGIAANRLRKSLLFRYVKLAGQNFCYRCDEEIMVPKDLSIEHKISWLDSDDPQKLFYDIDNIAFSHPRCNFAAARKNHGIFAEHGTISRYTRGCRCDICTETMKLRKRKRREYYRSTT